MFVASRKQAPKYALSAALTEQGQGFYQAFLLFQLKKENAAASSTDKYINIYIFKQIYS